MIYIYLFIILTRVILSRGNDVTPSEGLPHTKYTQSNNLQENTSKSDNLTPSTNAMKINEENVFDTCPSGVECAKLGGDCITCNFNKSCVYGSTVKVICQPKPNIFCIGPPTFERSMICQYCYQTPNHHHTCRGIPLCKVTASPREYYLSNCTVKSEIICLGRRQFPKNILCNWTSGYRWTTTLILSITLGGFGADRFYLGHWQEGIGKLFSFGGLGVWTIIDVILVAIGYLKPADGSLYIW